MTREQPPEKDAPAPHGVAASPLARVGGEFRDRAREHAFAWERMSETLRHARLLMIASAILNTLFLASDWRFQGTPHFWVAVPARLVVVAMSLLCLLLLPRAASPKGTERVMVAWMVVVTLAIGLLVTSHSDIALFVVLLLPMIFYLATPAGFFSRLACGGACSLVLLTSYEGAGGAGTELGLLFALAMLNVALAMTISRANRLERLQWLATHEQRRIAVELERSREMISKLFEASPVPLIVTDGAGGQVLQVNQSAVDLVGAPRAEIDRQTLTRFYADPADQAQIGRLLARDGHLAGFELEVRTASGAPRTVLLKTAVIDTHEGPINISGVIDISDRKAIERRLETLATTDPLTGLPNRLSFFASARAEMMRSARSGRPLALLMIDLDHFKRVNDGWGHQAGDQALKAFADLCRRRLRAQDVVGRLGGEEFGVLLPEADVGAACALAEALRASVPSLRVADAPGLELTVSIGVSPVRASDKEIDAALGRADRALYAAKNAGRNRVVCAGDDSKVGSARG